MCCPHIPHSDSHHFPPILCTPMHYPPAHAQKLVLAPGRMCWALAPGDPQHCCSLWQWIISRCGLWLPATTQGDGGLGCGSSCVLDRGWTLSRHRLIASLQFIPVVSGRSLGRWQFAPILMRDFSVSLLRAVVTVKWLNTFA